MVQKPLSVSVELEEHRVLQDEFCSGPPGAPVDMVETHGERGVQFGPGPPDGGAVPAQERPPHRGIKGGVDCHADAVAKRDPVFRARWLLGKAQEEHAFPAGKGADRAWGLGWPSNPKTREDRRQGRQPTAWQALQAGRHQAGPGSEKPHHSREKASFPFLGPAQIECRLDSFREADHPAARPAHEPAKVIGAEEARLDRDRRLWRLRRLRGSFEPRRKPNRELGAMAVGVKHIPLVGAQALERPKPTNGDAVDLPPPWDGGQGQCAGSRRDLVGICFRATFPRIICRPCNENEIETEKPLR